MACYGPIWLVKQVVQPYTAAVVGIVSRHGLRIEVHRRNQPNKSRLALCKPWIHFNSLLKQLYISNKVRCVSYKGVCGVLGHIHIEMFKRRAGLGYRLMSSGY